MANDLDVLMAGGKGALGGAGTGLALGSNPALLAATGGLSAPIGATAGALFGGISSGIKQNKANQAQDIPFVDPLEAVRLARLEQMRRNVLSGTDPITQTAIGQVRNVGAAAQGAISRNTGGDVGNTIDALLKIQKNTQSGVNEASAGSFQRLPYFDSAANNLAQRISQRKLELDLLDRAQKTAENAQARKEANLNANAFIGTQGGTMNIDEMLKMLAERKRLNGAATSSVQPEATTFDPAASGATNLSGDWATGFTNQQMPSVQNQYVASNFDYSMIPNLTDVKLY